MLSRTLPTRTLPAHTTSTRRLAVVSLAIAAALGASLPSAAAVARPGTDATSSRADATPQPQEAGKPYKKRLYKLVKSLPTQPENRRDGYVREAFPHWIDADGDCFDTRQEVLLMDYWTTVPKTEDCRVVDGEWYSWYDAEFFYGDGSEMDIDHMVPLAEAWDSGAWAWDLDTRTRFANDLDDTRSLVAASASSNRSKGDSDPTEWLPEKIGSGAYCVYTTNWMAVKLRWGLTIDPAEKEVLVEHVTSCDNKKITITPAKVGIDSNATNPGTPGDDSDDDGGDPEEPAGPSNPSAKYLFVSSIVYDPNGAQPDGDPNGEVVTIINTSLDPVSTAGVVLRDGAGHTYVLPTMTLPGARTYRGYVRVYSGAGTNQLVDGKTETDPEKAVYANWGHVWNNSGDSFTLRDAEGTVIQADSWTDKSTSDNIGDVCFGCSTSQF